MQEIYVSLLWKYLVYLYGYNQAAIRFASMVKSVLDMFSRVEELPVEPVPPQPLENINSQKWILVYDKTKNKIAMWKE